MSESAIELYYFPTANPKKITIMLEECGLPYEVRVVDVSKGEQFAPAFLRVSPNNRVPAIVDPGGAGEKPLSIFESGAILQYLGDKSGRFYPRDTHIRATVNAWLFWQVGGLGPISGQQHHFGFFAKEKLPYAIERFTNEVNRLYGVMNLRLGEVPFLAGEYSIADMACFPWVSHYDAVGQTLDEFPHLKRWFETVSARPAVRRGMNVRSDVKGSTDESARRILFNQRARVA